LGYQDPDWQRAHRSLVPAAINQAVGRARPIREFGCDVVVLSNEDAGLPLADREDDVEIVTESEAKILNALIAGNSYKDSLGDSGDAPTVKTAEIARRIGQCKSETRRLLRRLEARGLVERRGQRRGWRLSPTGIELAPRPSDVVSTSDDS
jgi:DNA-binding MarR family transcriptional regulator